MDIYLLVVIALLSMAAIGLIVGVANDAVNFMNSAIGSKAASRKVIVAIAGLGIFAGVFFSSNMMEVARKGIFHPENFLMPELMIIFVAAMFQIILLLDLYNTFGLPTSTTISVVFGLLGSALSVSMISCWQSGYDYSEVFANYIDISNVLKIILAIFLSIIAGFIIGAIFQWLTRLIFTFDYHKKFRRYGSIWGGAALTLITYFILIKGAKGSTFIAEDTLNWIMAHTEEAE